VGILGDVGFEHIRWIQYRLGGQRDVGQQRHVGIVCDVGIERFRWRELESRQRPAGFRAWRDAER
jgi:hypothetical protein